jgi:serine O-acetyltransferase
MELVYLIGDVVIALATWVVLVATYLRIGFQLGLNQNHFRFLGDVEARLIEKQKLNRIIPIVVLLIGEPGTLAVWFYRVSRFLQVHRLDPIAILVRRLSMFITAADIAPTADIGPGFMVWHGLGLVVGGDTKLGKNVRLCQCVTVGARTILGDNITMWPGSKTTLEVRIGTNSVVGANAVVAKSFEDNSVIGGVPAKKIKEFVTTKHPIFQHLDIIPTEAYLAKLNAQQAKRRTAT